MWEVRVLLVLVSRFHCTLYFKAVILSEKREYSANKLELEYLIWAEWIFLREELLYMPLIHCTFQMASSPVIELSLFFGGVTSENDDCYSKHGKLNIISYSTNLF